MTDSGKQAPKTAPEVPDLELEPAVRPTRSTSTAGQPRVAAPSVNHAFDEDDSLDFGGSLDLDPDARPGDVYFGAEDAAPPARRVQAEASAPAKPWPTGRTPERDRLAIDAVEVQVLADFGPVPRNAYLTLGYAYRVWQRRRELKRSLPQLNGTLSAAEQDRDELLADMADALRATVQTNERFARLFSSLSELEREATERSRAVSSVNAELDTQTAAIDSELVTLRAELSEKRALEDEASARVEAARLESTRAEAKLKRVQIEMRGVHRVAEQKVGPQGGAVPAAEAEQLSLLEARLATIEPEMRAARAAFESEEQAHFQVAARVALLSQLERQLERKRAALTREFRQELSVRGQGLSESERAHRQALSEVGRALLATHGAVEIPEAWLDAARAAEDRVLHALRPHELVQRALDAYDRPQAERGFRLALTLSGLLLLLIVLKIAF